MAKNATVRARVTESLKDRLTKAIALDGTTESEVLVQAVKSYTENVENKFSYLIRTANILFRGEQVVFMEARIRPEKRSPFRFYYELQHEDHPDIPVRIAESVTSNFFGTIISSERLEILEDILSSEEAALLATCS
ncbi:LPD28 domain-containing protein [Cytobacillus sp. FJAT-54145]|uniref:LPD28 domain-containing protein n=1 Tax=Cytobacillus spartinae TaxID=3299023 RepID=A0ABW6KAK7_9BACI